MLRTVFYLLRIAGALGCLGLAIYLAVSAVGWLLLACLFIATVILAVAGVAILFQAAVCLLGVQGLLRCGQSLLGYPARHQGWLIEQGATLARNWRDPLSRKLVIIVGTSITILVVTFRYPNVAVTPQEFDMLYSLFAGQNWSVTFPWEVAAGLMSVGIVQELMRHRAERLSK